MAENVRKRTSKWDVVAETHVPTEIRQDNALPVKVDDSFKDQESNSDWNSSESKWSDMRTVKNMLYKYSSGADQSSKWSELEEEDIGISKDWHGRPQSPKCSDMEAGNADGSKGSWWEPVSGNQTTAKVGNVSQSPKHPDVEAGDKDGSKWSQWEQISGNQTTEKDGSVTDGWGAALNQNYCASMPPALDAWRRPSHSYLSKKWLEQVTQKQEPFPWFKARI